MYLKNHEFNIKIERYNINIMAVAYTLEKFFFCITIVVYTYLSRNLIIQQVSKCGEIFFNFFYFLNNKNDWKIKPILFYTVFVFIMVEKIEYLLIIRK